MIGAFGATTVLSVLTSASDGAVLNGNYVFNLSGFNLKTVLQFLKRFSFSGKFELNSMY